MVSKTQIDRLHERIDDLEAEFSPAKEVCVISMPYGSDSDAAIARHLETNPQDANAKIVVLIQNFSEEDGVPVDRNLP